MIIGYHDWIHCPQRKEPVNSCPGRKIIVLVVILWWSSKCNKSFCEIIKSFVYGIVCQKLIRNRHCSYCFSVVRAVSSFIVIGNYRTKKSDEAVVTLRWLCFTMYIMVLYVVHVYVMLLTTPKSYWVLYVTTMVGNHITALMIA